MVATVTCENIGIAGCDNFRFGKMLKVGDDLVQYPFWWEVRGSDLFIHEYTGKVYSVEGGAVYLPVLESCNCTGGDNGGICKLDYTITKQLDNTPIGDWTGKSGFAIEALCKDIGQCGDSVSLSLDFKIERPCDDKTIGFANPINVFSGISYQNALTSINNLNAQLQDFASYAVGKQFTFSPANDCMGNTLGGGSPVTIIDVGAPAFNEFLIQNLAGATVTMRVTLSDNCGNSVTKEQSVVLPNVYKYIHVDGQGVSSASNPVNQSLDMNDLSADRIYYNGPTQVTNITDRLRHNCGAGITPYASVTCSLGSTSIRSSYDQWKNLLAIEFPGSELFVCDAQAFDFRIFSILILKIQSNCCDVVYQDLHTWQNFCNGFYANAIDFNATDYFNYLLSTTIQSNISDPVTDLGW